MKKILIVTAVALASALFLTNCSKEEQKEEIWIGVSEKELGEIFEVAETAEEMMGTPDASPTGLSFVQALKAITGKQPTPYYKDTVYRSKVPAKRYDNANLQGVFHLYEGTTELQIKEGTGTPVEEFSLQFAEKYKSVVTQEMLQIVKESTVDGSGIFEFTILPTTKAGDMQEGASKIYLRQLKSIVQAHPDIPNTDTEIPINSTSGE